MSLKDNLILRANKDALVSEISLLEALDLTKYSAENQELITAKIVAAKALNDDLDATQEAVDNLVESIKVFRSQLVEIKNETPNDPIDDLFGCTGSIVTSIFGLVALLGLIVILNKRRELIK